MIRGLKNPWSCKYLKKIEVAIKDNNLSKELKCVLWDDKG